MPDFRFLKDKKLFLPLVLLLFLGIIFMSLNIAPSDPTPALEKQIKALCESVDGVSDAFVAVSVSADGSAPCGIAVVCSGGDSPSVKLALTDMLSRLFNIPTSSVCIAGK